MEKLKEVNNKLEEENKLKNEQNELLIGEVNKLEENLARNNGILRKMFQERTAMNNVIEKQKTTIELIKQDSNSDVTEGGDGEIKAKIVAKIKELDQANKDKRRVANNLSEAQAKNNDNSTYDTEKCSKLTNLLKNQKGDTKNAADEVKKLTIAKKELQEKLNKVNNENTVLVTKTTRLEKQVDDLIETCGHKPDEMNRRVAFEENVVKPNEPVNEKSQTKFYHNDVVMDLTVISHIQMLCANHSVKLTFVKIKINVL